MIPFDECRISRSQICQEKRIKGPKQWKWQKLIIRKRHKALEINMGNQTLSRFGFYVENKLVDTYLFFSTKSSLKYSTFF